MSQFSDYRQAMKSYRRVENFARKNYALPFIPLILGAIAPAVNIIKIVGTIYLAIVMCKDVAMLLFKKVPDFVSNLLNYKSESKKYVAQQEQLTAKREKILEKQKKCIKLINDVGEDLKDLLLQEQSTANIFDKARHEAMLQTLALIDSPEYQSLLEGKNELSPELVKKQEEIVKSILKEVPEENENSGMISLLKEFLLVAGAVTGGPEAVNKLAMKAVSQRALSATGSLQEISMGLGTKALTGASKLSSLFFSAPMIIFQLGSMAAEWGASSFLNNRVQELARVAVAGDMDMQQLDQIEAGLNEQYNEIKEAFTQDILKARQVVETDNNVSPRNKERFVNQLDKLLLNMKQNFSVVTEAVGTLAKTGVNLLKNKTFDTAMLGMIAGMAIEKYKNKKEEELANRLLAEEAAKMRKFRLN